MESTGSNFPHSTQSPTQGRTGRLCPTCSLHVTDDMKVCPNDGTSLAVSYSPKVISNLAGQYEFLGKIGEGGMGVIYKARHVGLNQLVAIKMLNVTRLDDVKVLRFQQEAKAVSALDHPSIVRVRDFGISESGQPHMVLDFIDGVTLEQFIKANGPLSIRDARDIFIQICDAVGHAHQRNVLHRDLKPSNIMLVYRENNCPLVKIVDFGIAKVTDPEREQGMSLTRTGEVFGSPFYMSPEQTAGKPLDKRSDVYSVGCVFFESLTGTPPFVGQNAIETLIKHTSEAPPSLQEASLGKVFPAELQAVVSKVLAKDPAARYQDMQSLKDALIEAFDNLGKSQSKQAPASKSGKFPTRTQVVAAAAVSAVLLVALSATYFLKKSATENAPSGISNLAGTAGSGSTSVSATSVTGGGSAATNNTARSAKSGSASRSAALDTEPPFVAQLMNPATMAKMMLDKQKNSDAIYINAWCSDKDLAMFDDLTAAVKTVYLNNTAIEGPGLEHLMRFPLTSLSLRGGVNFKNDGLSYVIVKKDIEFLDLGSTKIDDGAVDFLKSMPRLKSLILDRDAISSKGLAEIEHLKLRNLSLHGCPQIQDEDMRFIAKMSRLEGLNLEADEITDKGLRILTSGVPSLTQLNVEETKVTDDGLKYLKALPHLRDISLARTSITEAGLRTLFNNNAELNTLNLNDAKAFSEKDFPVLEKAAKLQTLCLDGFKITPAGAKVLAKLNLKSLSLAKSTINDEALMAFVGSKSLKIINLSGRSEVTRAGAEKFMAARPDCQLLNSHEEAGMAHLPGYEAEVPAQMAQFRHHHHEGQGLRGEERQHEWSKEEIGRVFH